MGCQTLQKDTYLRCRVHDTLTVLGNTSMGISYMKSRGVNSMTCLSKYNFCTVLIPSIYSIHTDINKYIYIYIFWFI